MPNNGYDLAGAARQEMLEHGFEPEFPAEVVTQLAGIQAPPPAGSDGLKNLTALFWSSIDNDESRDLDQIEWAQPAAGGVRALLGIADVDSRASRSTPFYAHSALQTSAVSAGVRTHP